jgi:hypothetical protein
MSKKALPFMLLALGFVVALLVTVARMHPAAESATAPAVHASAPAPAPQNDDATWLAIMAAAAAASS